MVKQWLTIRFCRRNPTRQHTFGQHSASPASVLPKNETREVTPMNIALKTLAAASIASFVFAATPVLADQIKFMAKLTASEETPATDSKGTGTLDATYDTDTKILTWIITYQDLT